MCHLVDTQQHKYHDIPLRKQFAVYPLVILIILVLYLSLIERDKREGTKERKK